MKFFNGDNTKPTIRETGDDKRCHARHFVLVLWCQPIRSNRQNGFTSNAQDRRGIRNDRNVWVLTSCLIVDEDDQGKSVKAHMICSESDTITCRTYTVCLFPFTSIFSCEKERI